MLFPGVLAAYARHQVISLWCVAGAGVTAASLADGIVAQLVG